MVPAERASCDSLDDVDRDSANKWHSLGDCNNDLDDNGNHNLN